MRVQGDSPLAGAIRALVDPARGNGAHDGAGRAATGDGDDRVGVVVDVDPTSSSVTTGLARLGPDGVLLVAGRVGAVELDVQTEVHRRGATIAGVAPAAGGAGRDA